MCWSYTLIIGSSLKNGILTVSQNDDLLLLDFPKDQIELFDDISSIESAIGVKPIEAFKGRDDILAILESEDAIKNLNVDFESLKKTKSFCLIHCKEINHPISSSLNKRMIKSLNKADLSDIFLVV